MSSSDQGFVVLFGSAAAGDPAPRDLDVVVAGEYSAADAERLARQWWERERGGDAPPAEVHRQHLTGVAYLLRPTGAKTRAIVLAGEAEIRWGDVDSLPAALRLSAERNGSQEAARAMIERIRENTGGRIPLSMATWDRGTGIGPAGGYAGDGPIALEQALARGPMVMSTVEPELTQDRFVGSLTELLDVIQANPGTWSGERWAACPRQEPELMEGLRGTWIASAPAGGCGYVGERDIVFNYSPALPIATVTEIVRFGALARAV